MPTTSWRPSATNASRSCSSMYLLSHSVTFLRAGLENAMNSRGSHASAWGAKGVGPIHPCLESSATYRLAAAKPTP
jgi:hypothetical protein